MTDQHITQELKAVVSGERSTSCYRCGKVFNLRKTKHIKGERPRRDKKVHVRGCSQCAALGVLQWNTFRAPQTKRELMAVKDFSSDGVMRNEHDRIVGRLIG